ncbi:helicase domain-containing family protein [Dorcoceras hygrometricum]|uniref:Helicase domain-containing family protein n=1 Tax=Dorcoceras hygrometricum TaxID=472368 RepID=A0A2Z7D6S6_9LAMI|nr:helicase domain-containing family protein [Dorcoceras hygrometricum]
MVVDLIGIYGLKGPYCTLTTTNWFLHPLSVIPRGSWGDVARRSYHDPMGKSGIVIVDLIGIYGLKGPYCTLTTTNWFLHPLSVIPRGSWGDVARRSYHDPMGKSGIVIPEPQWLWAHG